MTKRIVAGIVVALVSVSSHAQLGQLFQSARDQVTQAATSQVTQGVRSATDDALQTTSSQARKAIDSARSTSTAEQTGDQTLDEARK